VFDVLDRVRAKHENNGAFFVEYLDGSSSHSMDNFEFLLECYAHGLGFQLTPNSTTDFTSLLDSFCFLFFKAWGKEI
jgi:hypothetical protein